MVLVIVCTYSNIYSPFENNDCDKIIISEQTTSFRIPLWHK